MRGWLIADRFVRERAKYHLTRALVERPESLPGWVMSLVPAAKRRILEGLKRIDASPYGRARVLEQHDRTLVIGGEERTDFATGCYLGLDTDITADDLFEVRRAGLRNGWSRASGTTALSRALEGELERRLGFECCRLSPSISLANYSIFHTLKGLFPLVILDEDAHMTVKRGVRAAYPERCVRSFSCSDIRGLREALEALPADLPKLVAVDGVYSMRGVRADLRAILDLCRAYNATCYVDDAHGFGILGEHGLGVAEQLSPEDKSRVILAGSFSKACSNPVAFVAFPRHLWYGIDAADFLTFCGPPSNVHSVVALRHLRAFDLAPYRARRQLVSARSEALHALCAEEGIAVYSEPGMPILTVRIADVAMERVVSALDARGIFAKIAICPVTRPGQECVRFCVTAAHSDAEIERLARALREIAPLCLQSERAPAGEEVRHVA